MSAHSTKQEMFWAGRFGDEYINRNQSEQLHAANLKLFSSILSRTTTIDSAIEFGSNIGMNLSTIHALLPETKLTAVEINEKACEELRRRLPDTTVHNTSILDFEDKTTHDLTLIKGVLIHINPGHLQRVYANLYNSSRKYICLAEYYNPTPVEVDYRGEEGYLFKRDFAGEMMDQYPGLQLLDYGFVYHRDNHFPQDDLTWFLLGKA